MSMKSDSIAPLRCFLKTLFLSALIGLPACLFADYEATPVPEQDYGLSPYRYTGQITSFGIYATAVLAGSNHTLLTAAHVVLDDNNWFERSQLHWSGEGENSTHTIRKYRYFSSYRGTPDPSEELDFLSRDIAFGYTYDLIGVENEYGAIDPNGEDALLSDRRKMVVGYPAAVTLKRWNALKLLAKSGPFTYRFEDLHAPLYLVERVGHGSGGSGAAVWVESSGEWNIAGVYVAGRDKQEGDRVNQLIAVAINSENLALFEDALEAALYPLPAFDQSVTAFEIIWEDDTNPSIQFDNTTRPSVVWSILRNGEESQLDSSLYEVMDGVTFIYPRGIPAFFYDAKVRLQLTNLRGTVMSEWIPIHFLDAGPPTFSGIPEFITVQESDLIDIPAKVHANPAVTSTRWVRYTSQDSLNKNIIYIGEHRATDPHLLLESHYFYDGAYLQLEATNIFGTRSSERIPIRVQPAPLSGRIFSDDVSNLTPGESYFIRFELDDRAIVDEMRWEYYHPFIGEWYEFGFSLLGWDREILFWGNDLYLQPSDTFNLNGTQIRVVTSRYANNPAKGNITFRHDSEVITLRQRGKPALNDRILKERTVSGDSLRLEYSTASEVEIEWQWLDRDHQIWRPFSSHMGSSRQSKFESTLSVPTTAYSGPIRAVLRSDDFPTFQTEVVQAGVASGRLLRVNTPSPLTDGVLFGDSRIITDGEIIVVRKIAGLGQDRTFDLLTIHKSDGEWSLSPHKYSSPPELSDVGFGMSAQVVNKRLYFGMNEEGADDIWVPRVIVEHEWRDNEWKVTSEIRIKKSELGATDSQMGISFGSNFKVTGDFLINLHASGFRDNITTRQTVLTVFKRQADGSWKFSAKVETNTEVWDLIAGIMNNHDYVFADGEYLFLHTRGGSNNPDRSAVFRLNAETQSLEVVDPKGLGFTPSARIGDYYLGHNRTSDSSRSLHIARWNAQTGVQEIVVKDMSGVISQKYEAFAQIYSANPHMMHTGHSEFYEIDPMTLELEKVFSYLPENLAEGYIRQPLIVQDGFVCVLERSDHSMQLDFILWDNAASNPVQYPKWLELKRQANGDVAIDYRAPSSASRSIEPSLFWSKDLTHWQQIRNTQVEVVSPDHDGDGATELRRAILPAPDSEHPLFFKAVEQAR